MFPRSNVPSNSQRWVNAIESSITDLEKRQPLLNGELERARQDGDSVINDVSANVNAYYAATMAQYPAFQRSFLMSDVLGGNSATIAMTAPASAADTDAETWFTMFSFSTIIPFPVTAIGVRLNSAQFVLQGPSAYRVRFRWRIGGTPEGINNNRWMNRRQFKLDAFDMSPSGVQTNITNRYVHWSGTSTTNIQMNLQASIFNIASPNNAVTSQSVTILPVDTNGNPSHLDVMMTV